ncbi:bifunctional DNA-formamidopyrimidine glycosylase/DNA-(apurinic or apyrimidinic site) lyase [Candidatus Purcelliella pentastirinorum]|nr:bifunctional DNA-formamidopyrimidine glycosylase/DNA-(apurinic or apyrimidinic site) lyase [Candidatus Purcelliella pentastirinorum]
MPELPEVENIVSCIRNILVNRIILYTIIKNDRLRWCIPFEIKQLFNVRVFNVYRRGKYIILKLYSGYIIIHLGMTGVFSLLFNKLNFGKHDCLDLILDNNMIIRYSDCRKFGFWLWFNKEDKNFFLDKLGPEPLSENFNCNYLYNLTRLRKISIKSFLMNSKFVAGIGNIYANESLFQSGIIPTRLSMNINFNECVNLVNSIKKILSIAIKHNGTTIKNFKQINGKLGEFSKYLKVYGRKNKLCKKCNNLLIYIRQNQRSSFFCKFCQS